jgi:hypothetical protein
MTSDSAAGNTPEEQQTGPQDAAPAESTPAESAQEATKRRFREALQAKQSRHGENHVEAEPHPTDHGHGPVGEKRVFRRKTG